MVQGLTNSPLDLWKIFLQNGQLPAEQGMPVGDRSIDISSLPSELKQIIEARRSDFSEGDQDKIDTENEYRKLVEAAIGEDPDALPNAPGMEALQNLSKDELTALLVDWLLNKQSEQNKPGRNLGPMQPAQHYGAGSSGAGYNNSGAGTSGSSGASGPVAPSGPATNTADIKGNTNAEKAFNYFIDKGLSPAQAAGIVANLQAESGVKPGQHQIGGPAFGIAQWEGGRQDNLRAFAQAQGKPIDDLGMQLDFLWQELQGPENAAFNALKGATTPYDAAAIFENKFERPRDNHNAERGAIAQQVFAAFGNGGGDNMA